MNESDRNDKTWRMESPRHTFETTQWSRVFAARKDSSDDGRIALESLCESYWPPLYCYARKRLGNAHDALEATQDFFAQMLEGERFQLADPERGRFRTFLLASLRNFLNTRHEAANAKKRGGNIQIVAGDIESIENMILRSEASGESPVSCFDRKWATTMLRRGMGRLEHWAETNGSLDRFRILRPFLARTPTQSDYRVLAGQLEEKEETLKVAVHRMRRRLGDMIRDEIKATLDQDEDIELEIADLRRIIEQF